MESHWFPDELDVEWRCRVNQNITEVHAKDPEVVEQREASARNAISIENVAHPEHYLDEYFRDHFTMSTQSSLVRFRSADTVVRVFENRTSQLILEERIDPVSRHRQIYFKQILDGSVGLQRLRGIYAIMGVFWTGIFFVFCLQILVVMVLEMTIHFGTPKIHPQLVDSFLVLG